MILHFLINGVSLFIIVLRIVPANGFILRNGDDPNLLALPQASWTNLLSVGTGAGNDLTIQDFEEDASSSRFNLFWRGQKVTQISWQIPGLFNARNLSMAILASALIQQNRDKRELSVDLFNAVVSVDFSKCRGVKRRQEVLLDNQMVTILSDFAHHPTAIQGALVSLKARYPDRRIIACFEPRSNTAVTNIFQDQFADALSLADEALIGEVHRAERIPMDKRINPAEMVDFISQKSGVADAFPTNRELGQNLFQRLSQNQLTDTLVVFFSNGSFDGVIQDFVKQAKSSLHLS
jgi:UDP-N-acetylmuramate: L-alanyl-gamma-D-glutamyl-meso-diaminopimelate ligase